MPRSHSSPLEFIVVRNPAGSSLLSPLCSANDENGGDDIIRALQRIFKNMITPLERNNLAASPFPENSVSFRDDILLPKSPFSCIVVEKGACGFVRKCRFSPDQTAQKVSCPRPGRSARPIVKNKVI
jgi:hypothetical protein